MEYISALPDLFSPYSSFFYLNTKHTPLLHPDSADAGQLILCAPSESEWGKHGWTHLTLQDAVKRFTAEVEKRREVAQNLQVPP